MRDVRSNLILGACLVLVGVAVGLAMPSAWDRLSASDGLAADSDECRALRRVFLPSAESVALTSTFEPTTQQLLTDLATAASLASDLERSAIETLTELAPSIDPTRWLAEGIAADFEDAVTPLIPWAADLCGLGRPAWACGIGLLDIGYEPADDGDLVHDDTTPTPKEAARIVEQLGPSDNRIQLGLAETRLNFGWTDTNGLVVRSAELTVHNGEWRLNATSTCPT